VTERVVKIFIYRISLPPLLRGVIAAGQPELLWDMANTIHLPPKTETGTESPDGHTPNQGSVESQKSHAAGEHCSMAQLAAVLLSPKSAWKSAAWNPQCGRPMPQVAQPKVRSPERCGGKSRDFVRVPSGLMAGSGALPFLIFVLTLADFRLARERRTVENLSTQKLRKTYENSHFSSVFWGRLRG